MTTAALVKELRQTNKELMAGLESLAKLLGDIKTNQMEVLAALRTASHPPMSSQQQKGGR